MTTYTELEGMPLAFPPAAAPAYVTLGRLISLIGNSPTTGKPLVNRQTAELIALSGAIDLLIAASQGTDEVSWEAVVSDEKGKLLVDVGAADVLRALPWVEPEEIAEPVFNVRVLPGRVDDRDNGRPFLGWHARMSDEDAWYAVTRWWQKPREDMTGRPFIATVAGLCVFVGRIRGITDRYGLAEFDVDTDESDLVDKWLFRRVHTPPGGNTAILRPSSE